MENKMIGNPFLPTSGTNVRRVVLTKHIQTRPTLSVPVNLKRM